MLRTDPHIQGGFANRVPEQQQQAGRVQSHSSCDNASSASIVVQNIDGIAFHLGAVVIVAHDGFRIAVS